MDDALVLTSDDFPAAVVKQRLGDKASIQALVEEVSRILVAGSVRPSHTWINATAMPSLHCNHAKWFATPPQLIHTQSEEGAPAAIHASLETVGVKSPPFTPPHPLPPPSARWPRR